MNFCRQRLVFEILTDFILSISGPHGLKSLYFMDIIYFQTCGMYLGLRGLATSNNNQTTVAQRNHNQRNRARLYTLYIYSISNSNAIIRVQDYLDSKTHYRNDVIMSLRFG